MDLGVDLRCEWYWKSMTLSWLGDNVPGVLGPLHNRVREDLHQPAYAPGGKNAADPSVFLNQPCLMSKKYVEVVWSWQCSVDIEASRSPWDSSWTRSNSKMTVNSLLSIKLVLSRFLYFQFVKTVHVTQQWILIASSNNVSSILATKAGANKQDNKEAGNANGA